MRAPELFLLPLLSPSIRTCQREVWLATRRKNRDAMREHATSQPVVFVIDNDASVGVALKELFQSVRLPVELFPSASAFLENHQKDVPSCLVLDVRLPGMSGLKLQEELATAKIEMPLVFLTGHGDVAMAVRAMKAGAIDFLTKPFRSQDLLDAVFAALERDSARRKMQQVHSTIPVSYTHLTLPTILRV